MFNSALKQENARLTAELAQMQQQLVAVQKRLEEVSRSDRRQTERAANAEAELARTEEQLHEKSVLFSTERREKEALKALIPAVTGDSLFIKIGTAFVRTASINSFKCHDTGNVASIDGRDVYFTANVKGEELAAIVTAHIRKRQAQR